MFPMEISENGRKWYPFFIVALHITREWSLTVLYSINLYNYTVHYLFCKQSQYSDNYTVIIISKVSFIYFIKLFKLFYHRPI